MSELSDYLMKHHFDVMTDEIIPNVDDAALEVIKVQDAALEDAREIIKQILSALPNRGNGSEDWKWCWDELFNSSQEYVEMVGNIAINWLHNHPTPPAQAGKPDALR